jgi:hypothetical protein
MPPSTYLRQKLRFQEVTLRVQLPSTDFGEFLGSKTLADPILPVLARTLAAGPCADLAFICGARGHPLTKESFGNAFKEAGSAKLGQREPLRTEQQSPSLKRYSGWRGGGMAALYTREANRARLSKGAIGKLERTPEEHSIPAPDDTVRAAGENPK